MLRLAIFGPLPPEHTGVADYLAELLPSLAREAHLTLFVDDPATVAPDLRDRFPLWAASDYPNRRWQFDLAIYHAGNSFYHRSIYALLRRYPGLTVLHDVALGGLISQSTLMEGDLAGYARELGYVRGAAGVARAHAVACGRRSTPDWPCCERVADVSLGVLVHSAYAFEWLRALRPAVRAWRVPQPIVPPAPRDRDALRARLGLPSDAFVVATAGHVIPEKRLDVTLAAFDRLHARHPEAIWLVAGEVSAASAGWVAEVDARGLRHAVRLLGYVAGLEGFYDVLAAADACVNLRHPTAGETSAGVLRSMAAGRPVVVSRGGWYDELPDDCCARVAHDGGEVDQLEMILEDWFSHPDECRAMGERARAFVARECDPARAARQTIAAVRETLAFDAGEALPCASG